MNELHDIVTLILGIFATVSGMLYVLTAIDPRTDASDRPQPGGAPTHPGQRA